MSVLNIVRFCGLGIVGGILYSAPALNAAVSTADQVLQYSGGANQPASYWGQPYSNTAGALGLPNPSINLAEDDALGIYPDRSIITPFNGDYDPANIVGLGGAGGILTVHMSQPISTAGYTLGIHAGVGLFASTDPSNPPTPYTDPRTATVLVSDGHTWVSLGTVNFDIPTNYYQDISSAFTDTPGNQPANFGQPFTGTLSSFAGEDLNGILATLDGSAGGTWLDLSTTGLSQVDEVEFQTAAGQKMFVDAVVGVPLPEPGGAVLLILPCLLFRRSRFLHNR